MTTRARIAVGAGTLALVATVLGSWPPPGLRERAGHFSAAWAQEAMDQRRRLELPTTLRDGVLAEMRQMLASVSGVLQSLAVGDLAAAERAARASGMGKTVDPRLRDRLPPEFLQLGMSSHRGWDALADAIRAGATREEALAGLARLTGNCVACHATYRLDEAR